MSACNTNGEEESYTQDFGRGPGRKLPFVKPTRIFQDNLTIYRKGLDCGMSSFPF